MEEMVEHGLFVGYVDPLGIAWGIRASADGERAGYPVLILGGRHGDLPLDPASDAIVSQFVLESRQPFILDLSLFEDEDEQRQFVAEFIRGFRLHEEVLCHLIVDEANLFAPQVPQSPMAQRSLTAMNRQTRRYRYKGMGCTLITQRPAELNKSVLGQIDLLLALRVISPQDSKALDDWIKRNAGEAERAQFLATLSGLPTGMAWAWSPPVAVPLPAGGYPHAPDVRLVRDPQSRRITRRPPAAGVTRLPPLATLLATRSPMTN
jgi:hypothetical protein